MYVDCEWPWTNIKQQCINLNYIFVQTFQSAVYFIVVEIINLVNVAYVE